MMESSSDRGEDTSTSAVARTGNTGERVDAHNTGRPRVQHC